MEKEPSLFVEFKTYFETRNQEQIYEEEQQRIDPR